MTVREAVEADLPAVLQVQQVSTDAPQWDEALYREMLAQAEGWPRRVLLVAEEEGLAGFAVVSSVLEEAELESVAVDPGKRRGGIGRQLCEAGMRWAHSEDAKRLRLEVRAGNDAARGLYAALGFEISGIRRAYYSDPVEDALVMVLRLSEIGSGCPRPL